MMNAMKRIKIDPLVKGYKKHFKWPSKVESYNQNVPIYDAMKELGFPYSIDNSNIFESGNWGNTVHTFGHSQTEWTKGAKAVFDWTEENLQDQWSYSYIQNVGTFYFQNEDDRLKFTLTWFQ